MGDAAFGRDTPLQIKQQVAIIRIGGSWRTVFMLLLF